MITLEPIGWVQSPRLQPTDNPWGNVVSAVTLRADIHEQALMGLGDFSHVEILFQFHLLNESAVNWSARHPRDDTRWPLTGIFAQRASARPNRLGSTVCELLDVSVRRLTVKGLDAVDGSPVLDIKPVFAQFLPRTGVRQAAWSHELMRTYWNDDGDHAP